MGLSSCLYLRAAGEDAGLEQEQERDGGAEEDVGPIVEQHVHEVQHAVPRQAVDEQAKEPVGGDEGEVKGVGAQVRIDEGQLFPHVLV